MRASGPWPGPPATGGTAFGGAGRLEDQADGRLSRAAMRASGPWPGPPADRRTAFGGAGAGKSAVRKRRQGRFGSVVIDLTKRGPDATVRRFLIGKLG